MTSTVTPSVPGPSSVSPVRALYEEFTFPLRGNHKEFVARYVLPHIRGCPKTILDAGCGTGNSGLDIARAFPESRIRGIDFSENSLREAGRLAAQEGVGNVTYRFHDLMQPLSSSDGKYDLVVSFGVIHHTPDPARVFRNLRAVIAEGGQFILAIYGKYGRAEIEMRRELVNLLRDRMGSANRDLVTLTMKLLSEPVFNENTFQKVGPSRSVRSLLRRPGRILTGVGWRLRRAFGREKNSGIPADIGIADQYLHPLVHSWSAAEWVRVAEDAGFVLDEFIMDPTLNGFCIPRDGLAALHDPQVRDVLSSLNPRDRYSALELIFRPGIHVFAFNAEGSRSPAFPTS